MSSLCGKGETCHCFRLKGGKVFNSDRKLLKYRERGRQALREKAG